jgi:hypothetical protein
MALKAREPERFDVLEFLAGRRSPGRLRRGRADAVLPNGKYRRPYLFVMTLKYSGKSFRKVTWKADQQSWARLHEEAWRTFGGSVQYVVLDNLSRASSARICTSRIKPGVRRDARALWRRRRRCRVADPNRKGTVERAIQHTQSTALKGRKFESIEEQNAWLAHWEERWAAPRIHGRKKRQVLEMFAEEKPHLQPLPIERMRTFEQVRRVPSMMPAPCKSAARSTPPTRTGLSARSTVRIYATRSRSWTATARRCADIRDPNAKGHYEIPEADRIYNPSRKTVSLLAKARKIGPHSGEFAQQTL